MQALQKKQIEDQRIRDLLSGGAGKTVEDRVDHCKHLQYVKHETLFAVLYSTIHKAAADNSIAGIKQFLDSRKQPRVHADDFDKNGSCPIHIAAEKGNDDAIAYLLKRGSSVNLRTTYGNTALMYACKECRLSSIRLLFNAGADTHLCTKSGFTAIHFAAQGDHVEAIALLVELFTLRAMDRAEADAEAARAAEAGEIIPSETVTTKGKGSDGADGDSKGKSKASASVVAPVASAAASSITMAKGTRGEGTVRGSENESANGPRAGDRRKRNKGRKSRLASVSGGDFIVPMQPADEMSLFESLSMLTFPPKFPLGKSEESRRGVDELYEDERLASECHDLLNRKSNNDTTPLHMASSNSAVKCVRFLVSMKVQINAVDSSGETALHKAARKNFHEVYEVLCGFGADKTIRNLMGETAPQLLVDMTCY